MVSFLENLSGARKLPPFKSDRYLLTSPQAIPSDMENKSAFFEQMIGPLEASSQKLKGLIDGAAGKDAEKMKAEVEGFVEARL